VTILYLLIPLAMVFMLIAIGLFVWSVRTGQFDDLDGPAHRILMDDDDPRIPRPLAADQRQPSGGNRKSATHQAG